MWSRNRAVLVLGASLIALHIGMLLDIKSGLMISGVSIWAVYSLVNEYLSSPDDSPPYLSIYFYLTLLVVNWVCNS